MADVKKEKEEQRLKLIPGMKVAKASVGIGLGNSHEPQKTSLDSTNTTTGENASAASDLLSARGGSEASINNGGDPLTSIQDQLKYTILLPTMWTITM